MLHYLRTSLFFLCITLYIPMSYAEPWFTGPIFTTTGHNLKKGQTNLEVYNFDINTPGRYNGSGKVNSTPLFQTVLISPFFSHGYTEWLDVQVNLPYVFNQVDGKSYNRLADTSIGFGFQLVEQNKAHWLPDIRFYLQETIPTGKFDQLNPALAGADATGVGGYRTLFAFNIEHLIEIYNSHYLRSRLNLSRLTSSSVEVRGLNVFGGTDNTRDVLNPGDQDIVGLAFEYTLTQNWVAVMEGYFIEGQAIRFNGILNDTNSGSNFLADEFYEYALIPAIEYNFSEKLGVIGGVWFPVAGKNTTYFTTYVLAINAFW